jgi:hypothetical protein
MKVDLGIKKNKHKKNEVLQLFFLCKIKMF